jgi:hypothetical protein
VEVENDFPTLIMAFLTSKFAQEKKTNNQRTMKYLGPLEINLFEETKGQMNRALMLDAMVLGHTSNTSTKNLIDPINKSYM